MTKRAKKDKSRPDDTQAALQATPDEENVTASEPEANMQTETPVEPATAMTGGDTSTSGSIPSSVRIVVSIFAFAALGIAIGLGFSLLRDSGPAPDAAPAIVGEPVPVDSKVGDNKDIEFDDDLRAWNLTAAPYISPLLNQLARQARTTLGGQIALCREQAATLVGVLEMAPPPDRTVAAAFDQWRDALDKALQDCIEVVPSGDDARDIKRLMKQISDTESLFAQFLASQRPRVDVSYDPNPSMYETARVAN